MTWDTAAAAQAQTYAAQGVYAHSSATTRQVGGKQCGENLAAATTGTVTEADAVKLWYDELCNTSPLGCQQQFSSNTGHYTQVVWSSSTALGCGKGSTTASGATQDMWVCWYCPSGNVGGQFATQVPAPYKSLAQCTGATAAMVPSCWNDKATNGTCSFPASTSFKAPSGSASTPSPSTTHSAGSPGGAGTFGGNTGNTGSTGARGRSVSGTLTLGGSSASTVCTIPSAMSAVAAGVAGSVSVNASAVQASCLRQSGRRLDADARRMQAGVVVRYVIQLPPGSDPSAVATALQNGQQTVQGNINAELAPLGIQVTVTAITAQVVAPAGTAVAAPDLPVAAPDLPVAAPVIPVMNPTESMPADPGLVMDAGRLAALRVNGVLGLSQGQVHLQDHFSASVLLLGSIVIMAVVAFAVGLRTRVGFRLVQEPSAVE